MLVMFGTTLQYTYKVTYKDGSEVTFVGEESIMLHRGCFYLPHPMQGQICGVEKLELIKTTTAFDAIKEIYDGKRKPAKVQGSEWDD